MWVGSHHVVTILLLLTTLVLLGNSQRLKKDEQGLFGLNKRLRSLQSKADDGDPADDCCLDNEVDASSLTFQYTGATCDESDNSQSSDDCDGTDPPQDNGDGTVSIVIPDNVDAMIEGEGKQADISTDGGTFRIVPTDNKFDSNTIIFVGGQKLDIHTSCSQPLVIGDTFGALKLIGFEDEDGERCGVCEDDGDGPDPGCEDPDKPNCYEGECVGCVNDMTGAARDLFCDDDDPDKTQCDAPQGEPGCDCCICLNDMADEEDVDSGCVESKPLCNTQLNQCGNECIFCLNDMHGSLPDTGCLNESKPICVAKKNQPGEECEVCVNDMPSGHQDSGCPKDEPLCEERDEMSNQCRTCLNDKRGGLRDAGCPEHCMICDAEEDEFGDECRVCLNDREGGGQDSGCPTTQKLCVTEDNKLDEYEDKCALCISDFPNNLADSGCGDPDLSVCDANDGEFGYECVICKNNMMEGIDKGCTAKYPLCNGIFDDGGSIASKGSGCFKCQNDGEDIHEGCPDFAPICVAAEGDYGFYCAICVNNADYDEVDSGCTDDYPACLGKYHEPGELCAKCVNDMPGNDTDSGCDEDPECPLCGADFGDPGAKCYKCVNDCPGDHQDTGCSSMNPRCDTDEHKYAKRCLPPEPPEVISGACSNPPGRIAYITFLYRGGDCTISNQQEGKAECDGDASLTESVDIEVSVGSDVYANVSLISIGDSFTASALNAGEARLPAQTDIFISDSGNLIQRISIHTSCSKPLAPGDLFGSLVITDIGIIVG